MIKDIRTTLQQVLVAGVHPRIIQSILDFDYLRGVAQPSIVGIVGGNKKSHKCWFGEREILLPMFGDFQTAATKVEADWLLNLSSGNSARRVIEAFFLAYPKAVGGHIFAENVPEQDALRLLEQFGEEKLIAGASGVGFLVPGALKLGAIGGIFGGNLDVLAAHQGSTAVVCSSGGMVNEIIDTILRAGGAPSFAVAYGGERFPITSQLRWLELAEQDEETKNIVYFGELGGYDEYTIVEAIQNGQLTKPIHAYIAGRYQSGDKAIQFGHAKALAKMPAEDALAKTEALQTVGVVASNSYADFVEEIKRSTGKRERLASARNWITPTSFRTSSLFTAVRDRGNSDDPFIRHTLCTLLERSSVSDVLVAFTDKAYSLLVDHGAEVSGAVNTMIAARAGRDMSASLASGILTVGDRFGGAINEAAENWHRCVIGSIPVETMLEEYKARNEYVKGIGHLKYSLHNPDPRVAALSAFAKAHLKSARHLTYAEAVAKRTTEKRANLILNVDGVVAAIVLDILEEHEDFSVSDVAELLQIEFFNSYFLIPRTVGFVGNYLSQARRDEGLFRLPSDEVFYE